MKYLWGLLLLMLGIGYLGASLGYLDYASVNQIWSWWPLILVFVGLDIMTRKLKFGWLIMVGATLIAGLLIYDISFAPSSSLGLPESFRDGGETKTTEISVDRKPEYKEAEVEVDAGALEFSINESTDKLLEGSLVSNFNEVKTEVSESNGVAKVGISAVNFGRRRMWLGGDLENHLRLHLNPDLPLALRVNTGASDLNLDLSKYLLKNLEIKAGASSIDVRLGDKIQNNATISFDSGASEINVKVPKAIGTRIRTESGLTSTDFPGFSKVGDFYENTAYASAAKKITITFKTGASSIKVEEF